MYFLTAKIKTKYGLKKNERIKRKQNIKINGFQFLETPFKFNHLVGKQSSHKTHRKNKI